MKLNKYIFLAVIVFAVAVRFFFLGDIPPNLNRDEVALGYNAYSLLKTGHDEHGVAWPVNFQSFGDWKLPTYVYSLIPFIAMFGLENWVVRLPSALAGVGVVILGGVLVWQILSKQVQKLEKEKVSLLVVLFLAVSPWAIHLSKVAYEANLAMVLLLGGIVAINYDLYKFTHKKRGNGLGFISGAVLLSLTLLTYHAYQVFTPTLIMWWIWLERDVLKKLWKQNKNVILAQAVCLSIAIGILITGGAEQANNTKFSGLSIFSSSNYSQTLFSQRQFFNGSFSFVGKVYANSASFPIWKFIDNLLAIFSTQFLFISGGNNFSHNIPGFGNLYRFELPLLIAGLYHFWREKKKWQVLLMGWLTLSILAPAITNDAAHTIRFSPALLPLAVISSYGFYQFGTWLWYQKNKLSRSLLIVFCLFMAYSYFHFMTTYFFVFPHVARDSWSWQMPEIVEQVEARRSEYEVVYVQGESQSPYIYFLYLTKYDPVKLEQELGFYPPDDEGFVHARRLENINFATIDWSGNQELYRRAIYVVRSEEFPDDKRTTEGYKILETLADPYSKYKYLIIEFTK